MKKRCTVALGIALISFSVAFGYSAQDGDYSAQDLANGVYAFVTKFVTNEVDPVKKQAEKTDENVESLEKKVDRLAAATESSVHDSKRELFERIGSVSLGAFLAYLVTLV